MDAFLAEQWKGIVGYPEYEVSTHGRVRRITAGKGAQAGYVLACTIGSSGYRMTRLHSATVYIYDLVASTFLGPKPINCELHHLDEDKTNDWIYNLEYKEIRKHRSEHKRSAK
jgi:hypothetical protein